MDKADGDVVERYQYDLPTCRRQAGPYGRIKWLNSNWSSKMGGDVFNTILFAGYRYEPVGLYYARNRHYHPLLGCWLSRDPIAYPDGLNLYQYVRSRPTVAVDPFGLQDPNLLLTNPPGIDDTASNSILEFITSSPYGLYDELPPYPPGLGIINPYPSGLSLVLEKLNSINRRYEIYEFYQANDQKLTGIGPTLSKLRLALQTWWSRTNRDPINLVTKLPRNTGGQWDRGRHRMNIKRDSDLYAGFLHESVHAYVDLHLKLSVSRDEGLAKAVEVMVGHHAAFKLTAFEYHLKAWENGTGNWANPGAFWTSTWDGIGRIVPGASPNSGGIIVVVPFWFDYELNEGNIADAETFLGLKYHCQEIADFYNAREAVKKKCVKFVCDPVPFGGQTVDGIQQFGPQYALPNVFR